MPCPKKSRFLVVDDYLSVRSAIVGQLKKIDITGAIRQARNVAEATELVRSYPIDFIISDWNLPGESGLDFLIWIRNDTAFIHLLFIILTTEKEKDQILSAINAGASNYLLKPWFFQGLVERVDSSWDQK